MTTGAVQIGALGPPLDGNVAPSNPATVIAQANQPTATPNLAACPIGDPSVTLETSAPVSAQTVADTISTYLSAGGSLNGMESGLRDRWGMINASESGGFVRSDLDLTGEGSPEVLVSLITPDAGGALLIFSCMDRRILTRYVGLPDDGLRGEPPRLLSSSDLNADGLPDLVFASRACDENDDCRYRTQMVTYDRVRGRFRNLLEGALQSADLPRLEDVDADRVTELILPMTDDGNAETGPLRTGEIVYDWNGAVYVRSFTNEDPPRFRVQVVQEADAAFAAGDYATAALLYQQAADDSALANWQNDDSAILPAYAMYRLLLLDSFTGDPRLVQTQARLLNAYPDLAAAPVYAEMALRYWTTLQATNNLRSACDDVRAIMAARPEAVELLNRYGSRSPAYSTASLCPF
ncbi:MAG: hypothetical protein U0452_03865 [Anaerolineae bacterium]